MAARRLAAIATLALAAGCGPGGAPADAGCRSADGGACRAPVCPPTGPGGTEPGDTLLDLSFPGCDDRPVALRSLCGARAGLVVTFYGWCPGCYDVVRAAQALQEKHRAAGLSTLVVVVQDPLQAPATAAYCEQARAHFGLSGAVVYDPSGAIEVYGTTDLALVSDPDARIVFRRSDASTELMVRAVEQVLGAP